MKLLSLILSLIMITGFTDQIKNGSQAQSSEAQQQMQAPLLQQSCQNLTPQEQSFASSLSAMHQALFCSCFGPDQRAQAMSYISSSSMNKTTGMTNDMAVEMTLKNCRGMQAMPKLSPLSQTTPSSPQSAPSPTTSKKKSACSKNSQ